MALSERSAGSNAAVGLPNLDYSLWDCVPEIEWCDAHSSDTATTERCLQVKFQQADKKPEKVEPPKARFSPLTELPPGDMHLTVMRRIDGCHVPTIVKYGIGRGGR